VGGIVGESTNNQILNSLTRFNLMLEPTVTGVSQRYFHPLGYSPGLSTSHALAYPGSIFDSAYGWPNGQPLNLIYLNGATNLASNPASYGWSNLGTDEDDETKVWILRPQDGNWGPRLRRVEDHSEQDMFTFVLSWSTFQ
jgi:hypothetical protein